MNLNWCYGPETVKMGFDLCDLDLWPLTVTFCMDIIFVNGEHSWKFQDDMMRGTCEKGVTDRRMDGWTAEVFLELLCCSLNVLYSIKI